MNSQKVLVARCPVCKIPWPIHKPSSGKHFLTDHPARSSPNWQCYDAEVRLAGIAALRAWERADLESARAATARAQAALDAWGREQGTCTGSYTAVAAKDVGDIAEDRFAPSNDPRDS